MSSFVAVETLQKFNEINKLYKYCIEKFPSGKPSKKSHVYFKNFLNTITIDLKMAILSYQNKIEGFYFDDQVVWSEYCKHIIRSFIVESFSLTENRLVEICNEREVSIKGLGERISKSIEALKNDTALYLEDGK